MFTRYVILLWNRFSRTYVPLRTFFGIATCLHVEQRVIRQEYPNVIFQPLTEVW